MCDTFFKVVTLVSQQTRDWNRHAQPGTTPRRARRKRGRGWSVGDDRAPRWCLRLPQLEGVDHLRRRQGEGSQGQPLPATLCHRDWHGCIRHVPEHPRLGMGGERQWMDEQLPEGQGHAPRALLLGLPLGLHARSPALPGREGADPQVPEGRPRPARGRSHHPLWRDGRPGHERLPALGESVRGRGPPGGSFR